MSGRQMTGDLIVVCDVEQPKQPRLVFARNEWRSVSGIGSVT